MDKATSAVSAPVAAPSSANRSVASLTSAVAVSTASLSVLEVERLCRVPEGGDRPVDAVLDA